MAARDAASYEEFSLGHLAVQRKADGALIGRCGLTELVVETATPEHGLRKGWFGRERAPVGLSLTFECELGYTFDPAASGQGFATEAARCVRDYARDVLRLSYAVSAILPHNTRSRRVAERLGAQPAGQMDVTGRMLIATCGRSRLAVRPSSSRRPRDRRRPAIRKVRNSETTRGRRSWKIECRASLISTRNLRS